MDPVWHVHHKLVVIAAFLHQNHVGQQRDKLFQFFLGLGGIISTVIRRVIVTVVMVVLVLVMMIV